MRIVLGVRYYDEGQAPDKVASVENFLRSASPLVDEIFLVIKKTQDQSKASGRLENLKIPNFHVLSLYYLGKFTPALNAIIYHTAEEKFEALLMCSPEILLSEEIIDRLKKHLGEQTLVVGAALAGHEFSSGEVMGDGATIPWNTLALWNLKYLSRTGFLLAGDAPFDPASAGVEELVTCTVLQKLYPRLEIKLVKISGVQWQVTGFSGERLAAHMKKIITKKQRAAKQLEFLELPPPKILHI